MIVTRLADSPEEKILEAAKIVFAEKGFEAATMGDIAAEAGISRTTLNYYYRTKENLFEAIFSHLIEIFLPSLENVAESSLPFLEKIDLFVAAYTDLFVRHPMLPAFVLSEIQRDVAHLVRVAGKFEKKNVVIGKIVNQIESEMESGRLRKMPLVDLVSILMGLVAFPVLARNLIEKLFLENDRREFSDYFRARRQMITEVLRNMLSP